MNRTKVLIGIDVYKKYELWFRLVPVGCAGLAVQFPDLTVQLSKCPEVNTLNPELLPISLAALCMAAH